MSATREIEEGERFSFGENWARFLACLDDGRIAQAERSLRDMIEASDLKGKTFLDAGSGSGLFSLAARRLGATVHSFDYDARSVACTAELRRRYFPDDPSWRVEEGSVLDEEYLGRLGSFDVVYSWGVLHHTGALWQAIENVQNHVRRSGRIVLSIYNDQGRRSRAWADVKMMYNRLPSQLKPLVLIPSFLYLWSPVFAFDLLRAKPFETWRNYSKQYRGMSPWRDVIDWVGGYPFEVARPEEIVHWFAGRGYRLMKLKTCGGGHGCNEFSFVRE